MPPELENVPVSAWTFPVVIDMGTDTPFVVGTAFPLRDGVLVTAKHLLKEWSEATEPKLMGETVSALQVLSGSRFITWRISGTLIHKEADLVLLFTDPSELSAETFIPTWRISQSAPKNG